MIENDDFEMITKLIPHSMDILQKADLDAIETEDVGHMEKLIDERKDSATKKSSKERNRSSVNVTPGQSTVDDVLKCTEIVEATGLDDITDMENDVNTDTVSETLIKSVDSEMITKEIPKSIGIVQKGDSESIETEEDIGQMGELTDSATVQPSKKQKCSFNVTLGQSTVDDVPERTYLEIPDTVENEASTVTVSETLIKNVDVEMMTKEIPLSIGISQKGESDAIETDKDKVESLNHDDISEGSKLMIDDEKMSEMKGRVMGAKQTYLGSWQVGRDERVQEEQFKISTDLDTVIESSDVEMIPIAQSIDALQKDAVSQCTDLMIDDNESSEMNDTVEQNVSEIAAAMGLNEKTETVTIKENKIEFHAMQCENVELSMQIDLGTFIESGKTVDVLRNSDKAGVVPDPEEQPLQEGHANNSIELETMIENDDFEMITKLIPHSMDILQKADLDAIETEDVGHMEKLIDERKDSATKKSSKERNRSSVNVTPGQSTVDDVLKCTEIVEATGLDDITDMENDVNTDTVSETLIKSVDSEMITKEIPKSIGIVQKGDSESIETEEDIGQMGELTDSATVQPSKKQKCSFNVTLGQSTVDDVPERTYLEIPDTVENEASTVTVSETLIKNVDVEMMTKEIPLSIGISQKGESDAIETDKDKVESLNHDDISEGSKLMIDDEKMSEMKGRVMGAKQTYLGSWQVGRDERVQEEQFKISTDLDTVIESSDVEMIPIAQSIDALQKDAVSQCTDLMIDDNESSEMNDTVEQNVSEIAAAMGLNEKTETVTIKENKIEFHAMQCENVELSMQIDLGTFIESGKTVDVLRNSDKAGVVPDPEEQPLQEGLPEWKKPGVQFGWAKSSAKRGKFMPGFKLYNGEFKWITTKSEVSRTTFSIDKFERDIPNDKHKKNQMKYVKKFNQLNETNY